MSVWKRFANLRRASNGDTIGMKASEVISVTSAAIDACWKINLGDRISSKKVFCITQSARGLYIFCSALSFASTVLQIHAL